MNARRHVLVIDDDAVVGRSFDRVLSDKGFAVDTALNGEQALRDIEARDYDVVFTDIRMPGMDGLEVAERIKARCPWTPIVVISGYGTPENEARASVLGVSGFVRKPLTPDIIESITLKALAERVAAPEPANEPVTAAVAEKAEEPLTGVRKAARVARNMGLFLAAPFIALGYVIALPAVGFYALARIGLEVYQERRAAR